MQILKDEKAQVSAEYILLFGGVIVIAVVAAIFYRNYLTGLENASMTDVQNVTNSLNNLNQTIANS
ncbi:MAG: class III signal peptide-containing protein [Methanobacterium sp.]|uniref:class III signal peptide-containing protein n=1 Tax=Methanobacterium sp. TaxID=2164 RepID=UPI003D653CB7|nr:class III signal peptide-containing protein [Methanobacterium sp.]